MGTTSLVDELLEIADGSRPGEMASLLDRLLKEGAAPRETLAEKTRYVIGLLRLQAKSLEQTPSPAPGAIGRLGLREWADFSRARAAELRREADEFEQTVVAAGLLEKAAERPASGRGLLAGLDVSEEEIEDAKRSVIRTEHDDGS